MPDYHGRLFFSAYFFGDGNGFFPSANTTRLKTPAEKGNKRAALVCRLLERYDRASLFHDSWIGNNIVNIATASIGTQRFVKTGDAGATISTVVVTCRS